MPRTMWAFDITLQPLFHVCPSAILSLTFWSSPLNLLDQLKSNFKLRWEMIVCFVDIGGIVDHHCLNFLSLFTWLGSLQNFSFYFDLEKNMVAIDHSCFWLAETLIISSKTKIPNNLLVDTENFDFVWIWQKHDTMRNSCFWLEEIKRSSALHLQRTFFSFWILLSANKIIGQNHISKWFVT